MSENLELEGSQLAVNAEINAVVERLRLYADRPFQIEISCTDVREGEIGQLMNAVVRNIKSGDGWAMIELRSALGDHLGHLEVSASHLTGTEVDSTGIGLEYGTAFVKLWDQGQFFPYEYPETPVGESSEADGSAASDEGLQGGEAETPDMSFGAVVEAIWRLVGATVYLDVIAGESVRGMISGFLGTEIVGLETIDGPRGRGFRINLGEEGRTRSLVMVYEDAFEEATTEGESILISFDGYGLRIDPKDPPAPIGGLVDY